MAGSLSKSVRKAMTKAQKRFGSLYGWAHYLLHWGFIPVVMYMGFQTKPWLAGKGGPNVLEAINAFW